LEPQDLEKEKNFHRKKKEEIEGGRVWPKEGENVRLMQIDSDRKFGVTYITQAEGAYAGQEANESEHKTKGQRRNGL
jgi:hypothetical protein